MLTRSRAAQLERVRSLLPDGFTVRDNEETRFYSYTVGKDGLFACVQVCDASELEDELKRVCNYLLECLAVGM